MPPAQSVRTSSRSEYEQSLDDAWAQHLAPRSKDAPTVVSLFAGCGGSSLGYSMAGYRELLAVEWDDNAVETLRLSFPDTPIYHGDITKLSADSCLELAGIAPGELDVLDGSPPCQGFSTVGRREMQDSRNQLYMEFLRLLEVLKPRVFVLENVSGMVKGKMKLIFADVLKSLSGAGYKASVRLLNAAYLGVPQSRERLIFIGVRNDLDVNPSHPTAQTRPITASAALIGVPNDSEELAWLLQAGQKYVAYKDWQRIRPGKSLKDATGSVTGFSCCKYHPNKPAHTVTKNYGYISMHGAMHWAQQRRFTVAEFKRFMSFPDQFEFAGSWSDAVQRMGNAVPPLMMLAVAGHVRETILTPPSAPSIHSNPLLIPPP